MVKRSLYPVKQTGKAELPITVLLSVAVTVRFPFQPTMRSAQKLRTGKKLLIWQRNFTSSESKKKKNEICTHMIFFHFIFLVTHFYCLLQKHRSTMDQNFSFFKEKPHSSLQSGEHWSRPPAGAQEAAENQQSSLALHVRNCRSGRVLSQERMDEGRAET